MSIILFVDIILLFNHLVYSSFLIFIYGPAMITTLGSPPTPLVGPAEVA